MLGVLVMALAAASGALASSASATSGLFCPGTSGTIALQPYGSAGNTDRCAWVYHSNVTWIWYANTGSVESCSALKGQSDGGGPDQGVPAVCPNNNGAAITILGSGYPGYATGINHSGNYHTGFEGEFIFT